MFSGSLVAIVTPLNNGQVDEAAFADLIEYQIANGTHGIVPCGTTGESATLSTQEHEQVVALAVEIVNQRVTVIAGTGSNSTDEAITLTKHAKSAGADGALLITPYYNKPMPAGLVQHYSAIARATDIPLVLYNIPGRTGVNMTPDTVAELANIASIVAIKEGSGSLQQVSAIMEQCGDKIVVLAGDDPLTLPMMAIGAKGVITVTANIAPADMANMVDFALKGNYDEARKLHYKLAPLFTALFFETNPIPVKAALAHMGKIQNELRLPLTPISPHNQDKLLRVMKACGLN